jgi:maleate isomerase
MNDTAKERWRRLEADYGAAAPLPVIGIIGLATDRVGIPDFEDFLAAASGRIEVFSTRIPMSPVATPESLAAMGAHLEAAAGLIVPHGRLDVVGFSCTSGTVAIGPDRVGARLRRRGRGWRSRHPCRRGRGRSDAWARGASRC